MLKNQFQDSDYEKLFRLWKAEEYFNPIEYPELRRVVKIDKKEFDFDCYLNEYTGNEYTRNRIPVDNYHRYNNYLKLREVDEEKLYNRINIYYGCYKTNFLLENLLNKCNFDISNKQELEEISGRFYLFSAQITLDGSFTEECVKLSPFFISIIKMLEKRSLNVDLSESVVQGLNNDVNEILVQSERKILSVEDVHFIKKVLFDKLKIFSEKEVGLQAASDYTIACKGLTKEEESTDYMSFYLNEIELVSKNFKSNSQIVKYTAALMNNDVKKTMIDEDIVAMQKWLEADRFPRAKYPSKFSPTLMQQVAVNIAISDKERNEKIFSVNGPPGTGKTTLLKEIIASNIEKQAELLIEYGIDSNAFTACKIESSSSDTYIDKYFKIPDDIAQYGILVVSNNNGAVENISLELPKAKGMTNKDTWTNHFDREENDEIYFSKVADKLLGEQNQAWGLISARMGRKKYVSELLNTCIFAKKNDNPEKLTLDSVEVTSSWENAVENFKLSKQEVDICRKGIFEDQELLRQLYASEAKLNVQIEYLEELIEQKVKIENTRKNLNSMIQSNESETQKLELEIAYIKKHVSLLQKILIFFGFGEFGKKIKVMKQKIVSLINDHGGLLADLSECELEYNNKEVEFERQREQVDSFSSEYNKIKTIIYETEDSLKKKYGKNLADREFFTDIKESEDEQNACPWTYPDYDKKREELFFAALQVRKAFVLNSQVVKRNLYVYQTYLCGGFRSDERTMMFPHLFNALSMVIPVLSSTFASVGNFLKDAGNQSLGMLIIDEAGQATPQSALGAIYRTKKAIVVGDPLQVEPVVTIPQIIVDLLADGIGVPELYKKIENSVQGFADQVNEFNGMIGKMKVGCPLVVHRRCIEPMFSISNMISYDKRMFNKTKEKEKYLEETQSFMIKKSGWIDIKGEEKGGGNHFVENQAVKVCEMLEEALIIYPDLFERDDAIYIISPFKLVATEMKSYILQYFQQKGFGKEMLSEWTKNCIGTVHTFQGKDANEVIFVLGCSSERIGSMRWVVKKANILNVACTRAKYRIAFVGNIEDWRNLTFFDMFIPNMISTIK